jgi:hypothetical protein
MIIHIEAIDEKTGYVVRRMDLVGPEMFVSGTITMLMMAFIERAKVSIGRLDAVMAARRRNAENGEGKS